MVEENKDYWDSRNLACVPEYLLDRIGELGDVLIHEQDLNHLFEPPKQLLESLHQTTNIYTFYSYFCPTCPYNYAELSNKNANFHLLLTQSVYDRLKDEYTDQYNAMMASKNAHLYICNDDTLKPGALSVTDDLMLISFFNKEGIFDHKKLLCFEESALLWGKDLFLYYKEKSEEVK